MLWTHTRLPDQDCGTPYRKDRRSCYGVRLDGGTVYVVTLGAELQQYGDPPHVRLTLHGTQYHRIYTAQGETGDPPTVADLPGGWDTINAFLVFWHSATPERREDMAQNDEAIKGGKRSYFYDHVTYTDRKLPKLAKWTPREFDEAPRVIPASNGLAGGFSRFYTKDLIAALKGTKQAVRFGPIIVKPTVLRELAKLNGPTLEVRADGDTVQLRTPDRRQRMTLLHGAGDRYAGRNGYEASIAWATD